MQGLIYRKNRDLHHVSTTKLEVRLGGMSKFSCAVGQPHAHVYAHLLAHHQSS